MRIPISVRGALRVALDALVPMRASKRARIAATVEPHAVLVSLSVRSAFAALIEALDLQPGDEIAMSAATINDMAMLPDAYGVRVVPVAVDPLTLRPCVRSLTQAITPRTRVFVAAHLFGGRTSLAQCATIARAHGVLVVADAAQALGSDGVDGRWLVDEDADITMLSFGSIKTGTTLGGGIAICRDHELARRMSDIQAAWPVRSRSSHAQRALKYALFTSIARPWPFGALLRQMRKRGADPDTTLNKMTKGFGIIESACDLREAVRVRPDIGLQTTLARRMRRGVDGITRRRRLVGTALGLRLGVRVPGNRAGAHAWWLVPINCRDDQERSRLRSSLLGAGFDAVPIEATNLIDIALVQGLDAGAPSLRHALLLPSLHGMSRREAMRMADIICAELAATPMRATFPQPLRAVVHASVPMRTPGERRARARRLRPRYARTTRREQAAELHPTKSTP